MADRSSRITEFARRHVRLSAAAIAVVLVAGVVVGLAISGVLGRAHAGVLTYCAPTPSKCGFPDATNTGPPAGATLQTVPGQVSSGLGWKFSSYYNEVDVTGNGAVLTGLYIPYPLNITASNVTVNAVKVIASGTFGVTLRHTTGVTIENSIISGQNATSGRVSNALDDVYGDSTGMVIKNNNISYYRTAIAVTTGVITGNYIHNPGYVYGDHTNGIFDNGSTQQLTISGNTIFNSLGQTDAISLNTTAGGQVANKTVTGNLIAGGGYAIYGGASLGNANSNIDITNNDFGQLYYPRSGQYGAVAYFNSSASGSSWSGNTWDSTGATVPAP